MASLRRLLALTAPYRGLLAVGLACSVLASLLDSVTLVTLVPLLKYLFGTAGSLAAGSTTLERWVDAVAAPLLAGTTPGQAVARMVVVLAAGLILKNAFSYSASQISTRVQEQLTARLRSDLFRHLLALDLGWFQRTRGGQLVNVIVQEADQAKGVVTASLVQLFQNAVLIATTLALLFSISVRLTVLSLVCLPPLVLGVQALLRRLRHHARARTDERAELASRAGERLAAIRLVRASGMEPAEAETFAGQARSYARKAVRTQRFSALTGPVSEAFSAISVILIIWAGTNPALLGLGAPLKPEVVIVFLMASLRLTSPLKQVTKFPADWAIASASLERVFSVLDEPPAEVDPPGARTATFAREIAFERVSFAYRGGEPVLREVSLALTPGRVVALVGPSGAGKSTLADLLPRLIDPTAGRILFDGVPGTECSRASVRRLLGVVSQDTQLLHDTVIANIAYGMPGATRAQVERAAAMANAAEFIARLPDGYDTVLGERGTRLSGGQRQRIAIARALLRDAPILVLDEATSALDPESERLVQEAIERLMANRTALVIAHRLATVRNADEILVLDEGRIVQRGTHAALLAAGGLYRRLHDLQFRDEPAAAAAAPGAG